MQLQALKLEDLRGHKVISIISHFDRKCYAWKNPNAEIELKEENFTRKLSLQD